MPVVVVTILSVVREAVGLAPELRVRVLIIVLVVVLIIVVLIVVWCTTGKLVIVAVKGDLLDTGAIGAASVKDGNAAGGVNTTVGWGPRGR